MSPPKHPIHPVLWQSPPNQVFTAERLREVATYCDVGTWSIAKIIAATTSKEVNTVHADMSQTTYFNAEQSKAYGVVNTIVTELFPAGSSFAVIEEDGTVRDCSVSAPDSQSTSISDLLAGLKLTSAPAIPKLPLKPS